MSFAEDAVRLLAGAPGDDARPATEVGRGEALTLARRAQATADPVAALTLHLEALGLDPNCKGAHEGIAKLVLAHAGGARPVVEATLRMVDRASKRSPEPGLQELVKKLRAALPGLSAHRETAMARVAAQDPSPRATRLPGAKPSGVCPYCNSPIPAGAPGCRSCNLSGELVRPDGLGVKPVSLTPFLVGLVVILIAGGGLLFWFLRHR